MATNSSKPAGPSGGSGGRAASSREGSAKAVVAEQISQAVQSTSNLLHLMQESSPSQVHLTKLPTNLLAKTSTIKNTEQILEQMPHVISSLDAHLDNGLQSVPHLKTVTQLLANMEGCQLKSLSKAPSSQEYKMEREEPMLMMDLDPKIFLIFSDFMSRVTQFEELVAVGSRLLVGFHQGLESLRRSPINKTSELVERIIGTNKTERVLKYIEAGCVNAHDGVQNISRLHTCQVGLQDHVSKGKCIVHELEGLVKEVTGAITAANENKMLLKDNVTGDLIGLQATASEKEKIISSNVHGPEIPEYAVMMGVIYSMLKSDYIMQEKIISSLNLKLSSGELESYNLMWSLRPFIDDEIMHQAWRLVA